MSKPSILDLHDEEDILLVLNFIDELVRLNIASNKEYNLHIEWEIYGEIRNNIKTFNSTHKNLLKGVHSL